MVDVLEAVESLNLSSFGPAAHGEFRRVLQTIVEVARPGRVLEVGGGRSPVGVGLGLSDMLTVNDISPAELSLLPPGIQTLCCDISDPCALGENDHAMFDFVFSQSVLEHVRSVDIAMRNTSALLNPGGLGVHFFPTLYASPFVLNRLIPFGLSRPLVNLILRPEYERFPGTYRGTKSTRRQIEKWKQFGFSEVRVHRFFDHGYYRRIPVLRSLETFLSNIARERDWAWYSSYAIVVVRK